MSGTGARKQVAPILASIRRSVVARSRGIVMSFEVGRQVVCVNDGFSHVALWRRTARSLPRLNSVYTIREIYRFEGLVGLYFFEILNPSAEFSDGYGEPCFNSKNFRLVKSSSIEIFEKLLAPAGHLETV
jgi:hypothetical protein